MSGPENPSADHTETFDDLFVTGGGMLADIEEDLTGDQLGVWQIEGLIARGGTSAVYRAERCDGVIEQRAALKILNRKAASLERRFRAEQQILADLDHPHIARILDVGISESGRPYLLMDLVQGEELDVFCAKRATPLLERMRLVTQVLGALEHAHSRGVFHHDIKPANILVSAPDADGSRAGSLGHPRLVDFGIAMHSRTEPANAPLLTPRYAAPEQFDGRSEGAATDIFQVGLLIGTLALGRHPADDSESDSRRAIEELATRRFDDIPSSLAGIMQRCLAKVPAERYGQVADVRVALQNWIDSQSSGGFARSSLALAATAIVAIAAGAWFLSTERANQEARDAAVEALVTDVLAAGAAGEDVITSSSFELSDGAVAGNPKLERRLTAVTARELIQSGRPQDAITLIRSVIERSPGEQTASLELRLLEVRALLMQSRDNEALLVLDAIGAQDTGNLRALGLLGIGERDAAITATAASGQLPPQLSGQLSGHLPGQLDSSRPRCGVDEGVASALDWLAILQYRCAPPRQP